MCLIIQRRIDPDGLNSIRLKVRLVIIIKLSELSQIQLKEMRLVSGKASWAFTFEAGSILIALS